MPDIVHRGRTITFNSVMPYSRSYIYKLEVNHGDRSTMGTLNMAPTLIALTTLSRKDTISKQNCVRLDVTYKIIHICGIPCDVLIHVHITRIKTRGRRQGVEMAQTMYAHMDK
jgi:hypothetical protein